MVRILFPQIHDDNHFYRSGQNSKGRDQNVSVEQIGLEEFWQKGPKKCGVLSSSGSFAVLRMTAKTNLQPQPQKQRQVQRQERGLAGKRST